MSKFFPHSFTKKICHWWYCARCGLIALNNDATRNAMAKGCEE
jgi:hypothetical protein